MNLLETYLQILKENDESEVFVNSTTIEQKLIESVSNNYVVWINYSGDLGSGVKSGRRKIQPVALGRTKNGSLAIRAYQTDGVTKTNKPDWKIYLLDRITDVRFAFISNKTIPKFNSKGDKSFSEVYYLSNFGNNNNDSNPNEEEPLLSRIQNILNNK